MEKAPFFDDVAGGPTGGHAIWLTAPDGVRLRAAVWPEGARGTVLLFPGRTEYVEKYGPAAAELQRRGYATVAVDWRGQGLADRMLKDPNVGHIGHFPDFQKDVAALMQALPEMTLPQPLYLVSHSMGGCIALRALMEGLPVKAAVFSAPMWDIQIPKAMRAVARALSAVSRPLGFGGRYAPGTSGEKTYVEAAAFDGNELTTDPDMYAFMQRQVGAYPDLSLGGPSLSWVHEAMIETARLSRRPSPAVPTLTFLGTQESIVCAQAITARMAHWPGGRLIEVPGARHEVMMEQPETRQQFFDDTAMLFDAA